MYPSPLTVRMRSGLAGGVDASAEPGDVDVKGFAAIGVARFPDVIQQLATGSDAPGVVHQDS
jgi:hypothetical protein